MAVVFIALHSRYRCSLCDLFNDQADMKTFMTMVLLFVSIATQAQDVCWLNSDNVISTSVQSVDAIKARLLKPQVSVAEAVSVLGRATRDVGSGLYVFQWDLTDGSVFQVSSGADFCKKICLKRCPPTR